MDVNIIIKCCYRGVRVNTYLNMCVYFDVIV